MSLPCVYICVNKTNNLITWIHITKTECLELKLGLISFGFLQNVRCERLICVYGLYRHVLATLRKLCDIKLLFDIVWWLETHWTYFLYFPSFFSSFFGGNNDENPMQNMVVERNLLMQRNMSAVYIKFIILHVYGLYLWLELQP